MFRKFWTAYTELIDEIRLWTAVIKQHREQLEAQEAATPPDETTAQTNGQEKEGRRPTRARR